MEQRHVSKNGRWCRGRSGNQWECFRTAEYNHWGSDIPCRHPQQHSVDRDQVTNYYKQNLYDPSDSKIGEIVDLLVGNDGKIAAFIVSVGGFLGMDSKDVAVPFNAVHATQKNGSWYLTMNATKDALKGAPGYKYDKAKANWVPA
jgi:PRC-barrel domain